MNKIEEAKKSLDVLEHGHPPINEQICFDTIRKALESVNEQAVDVEAIYNDIIKSYRLIKNNDGNKPFRNIVKSVLRRANNQGYLRTCKENTENLTRSDDVLKNQKNLNTFEPIEGLAEAIKFYKHLEEKELTSDTDYKYSISLYKAAKAYQALCETQGGM